ncbi:hypothetical protein RvY_08847-2 [Ramazzottius varieornatus]|uniref:RING-type domain-containing protein n=1 Tax=Ramazzottius varieornatus TaxID=947166 RepID=A0A1D1VBW7_RAMVA|nr:hypothetical protein RvY_08847-2 [Ramazzottius varieornatus]
MTNPQYYCYQCANQTQVDPTEFVCKRCGGGFIQEMPADPTPPPRDPQPAATASSSSASLSGYRQFGLPTASTSQASQTTFDDKDSLPSSSSSGIQQQQNVQQQPHSHGSHPFFAFAPHPTQQSSQPHHHHHAHSTHPTHIQGQSSASSAGPFASNGYSFGPFMSPTQSSSPQPHHLQGAVQQPMSSPLISFGLPQPSFSTSFGPPPPHFSGQPMQQHHQQQMPHFHFVSSQQPNQPNQGHPNPGQGNFMMVGVDVNGNPGPTLNIPGNMNNLMQMLTENIDDVITAVLNQLGTQGGPPPMTQQMVDAIPTHPATTEMIAENRTCSICMENFNASSTYKEMPCNHQFHGSCIDRWLILHGNCPVCRTNVQTGEPAGPDNDHGGIQEVNVVYQVGPVPAPQPMFAPHGHFHPSPQRFVQPVAPGNFVFRSAQPHHPQASVRPTVPQVMRHAFNPGLQSGTQSALQSGMQQRFQAAPAGTQQQRFQAMPAATVWSGQVVVGQGQPGQQPQMQIFVNPAQPAQLSAASGPTVSLFGPPMYAQPPPPSPRPNGVNPANVTGTRPTRVRQQAHRMGQPRTSLRAPTASPQVQPQSTSMANPGNNLFGTIMNTVAQALGNQSPSVMFQPLAPAQQSASQTASTSSASSAQQPPTASQRQASQGAAVDIAAAGDSVANSASTGSETQGPKQPKDDIDLD